MASDHDQGGEDLQAQISAALARRGQRQQAGSTPRIEPTLGLGGMGPGADRGTPPREALNEEEPAPEIPPAPVHFRRDDEPLYPPRSKAPAHKGGRRSWLWFILPVVGVPVVVLIALFYYLGVEMQGEGVQDSAPLIAAPEGPDKVKPANEGGMAVEGMDSAVLNQTGNGQAKPPAEQLLPPPEEPLTPPGTPPATPPSGTGTAAPGEGQTATGGGTAAEETSTAPTVPSVEVPTPPPAATAPTSGETGAATAPAATTGTGTTAAAPAQSAATQSAQPTLKPLVAQPDQPTPEPSTTQTATAGSYRVQLAALQSEEAAAAAWSVLQKKYPDLLGPLTATILKVDLGAQGIFYRVQGGPLPDRQAAEKLCGKLDQRGQACLVVRP
jgi:cell division septation protein DedD